MTPDRPERPADPPARPPAHPRAGAAANLLGSLLMTGAMAGFAVEDAFLKEAARTLPVGEVLMLFGAAGMALFAALCLWRGERPLTPAMLSPLILVRAVCEVTGRAGHTLALALAGLSLTSVILQATPLVVIAGAALLFGERVGWRRAAAVAVGFAGVLLVLRPGAEGLGAGALFAVLGMLGFAGRDLATRAAPPAMTTAQLGVLGFGALVVAGALLLAVSGGAVWPEARAVGAVAAATLVGVLAYALLTAAMRTGEVSAVTPFRYTRIVFGVGLGTVVFGEQLDGWTLAGAALIVGSGLYSLLRERRLARG
ncbi:MAG: DMT family transporter [Paracoccaceae bacterium]|jgi:drug/metabolite transporter (DMT)-like permease|nr:DMT family transporter [Paracoccaceae bacterium]